MYDYSQAGAYFVTICVQMQQCLFGSVVKEEMRLNDAGNLVRAIWQALPTRFPSIELDQFVVMPNHIHGIILIVGAGLALPNSGTTAATGAASSLSAPACPAGAVGRCGPVCRVGTGRHVQAGAPTLGDVIRAHEISLQVTERVKGKERGRS